MEVLPQRLGSSQGPDAGGVREMWAGLPPLGLLMVLGVEIKKCGKKEKEMEVEPEMGKEEEEKKGQRDRKEMWKKSRKKGAASRLGAVVHA